MKFNVIFKVRPMYSNDNAYEGTKTAFDRGFIFSDRIKKLYANLNSKYSGLPVLSYKLCDIGLDIVDAIREEFNTNVPINKINNSTCCLFAEKITIDLTEETARECKHFKVCSSITVYVPPLFLDGYQDLKFEPVYTSGIFVLKRSVKKIDVVHVNNTILKDDIYNDWRKAGYPLNWGF